MPSSAACVTKELRTLGYRACITSIDKLDKLEAEYTTYTSQAAWNDSPHLRQHLFQFSAPSQLPNPESIIIVAVPLLPVKMKFMYQNKDYIFDAPTVLNSLENSRKIIDIIENCNISPNCSVVEAKLPTKMLASHCGLLENGLNNMGYISGMGSFFQLISFFSDILPNQDTWENHKLSKACLNCSKCIGNCPTGCITPEKFEVLRCLSLLSKEPYDFPDWIKSQWHNSIIGCQICQLVCPMNRSVIKDAVIQVVFNEKETSAILDGVHYSKLDLSTKVKLLRFHLDAYYQILPRNLSLLLQNKLGETLNVNNTYK